MRRSRFRGVTAAAAALALLPVLTGGPGAAETSGATALISSTVDDVLGILNDESLSQEDRLSRIQAIAYDRFDFVTMSQLVVARYWRTFTPEQKDEFVREFKVFLSRSYGDRIGQYTNEKVEIAGESPAPRGDVKVMTRIVGGEFGGAEVEYRVRQKDGRWWVIDVKVEGISLVINYRDQFKSLLSRGGAEKLLERLKEKNAEGGGAAGAA